MVIKFQIIKSVIIETVKSTTYLKAKMDGAVDDKAVKVSFNEAAGDDEVHERTLSHDFQTGLEKVKVILAEYLVPNAQTIGDNIIYYNNTTDDVVEFVINASRRCNGTLTDTLARVAAKYIEDFMIYQWWLKTTNLKQAEPYFSSLALDEQDIRRCFVLSGPLVPTIPYTKKLSAKVDGSSLGGAITLELGEDSTLTYSIDTGAIDDIEAHSGNPSMVEILRSTEKCSFTLRPRLAGVTSIHLFSRHSDSLDVKTQVTIVEERD